MSMGKKKGWKNGRMDISMSQSRLLTISSFSHWRTAIAVWRTMAENCTATLCTWLLPYQEEEFHRVSDHSIVEVVEKEKSIQALLEVSQRTPQYHAEWTPWNDVILVYLNMKYPCCQPQISCQPLDLIHFYLSDPINSNWLSITITIKMKQHQNNSLHVKIFLDNKLDKIDRKFIPRNVAIKHKTSDLTVCTICC